MMNYSKFMMNDDDQYQTEQRIKSPEDDCGLALTHRHGNFARHSDSPKLDFSESSHGCGVPLSGLSFG